MSPERSVKDLFGPYTGFMERAMGIEPTSAAWEAAILPLNHARSGLPYQTDRDFGKSALERVLST